MGEALHAVGNAFYIKGSAMENMGEALYVDCERSLSYQRKCHGEYGRSLGNWEKIVKTETCDVTNII